MTAGGVVTSVRGAVVDVAFDGSTLPAINSALVVEWDRPEPLVLEVHSHVDPTTVRAIALQATAGLARGARVTRHRRADLGSGGRRGARPAARRGRRGARPRAGACRPTSRGAASTIRRRR